MADNIPGTDGLDCNGVSIPVVDESALPCDGLLITTDCIVSTKAFNPLGTSLGEYLTIILDKISSKIRLLSNLININTDAIAQEIARAIAAESLKANIASPTLTGLPKAPTAAPGTNTTQIATTEYVDNAIAYVAIGSYTLPTATGSVLGGIKVGTGLSIDGSGILSAPYSYSLPISSSTVLGGIKVGTGLSIDGLGVLSATYSYSLPTASSSVLGGIKIGTGLSINGSGVVSTTYINSQKEITTNYVLSDADNDYTIFINNGATAISISLGAITIPNFTVGFIQEGSADVTFSGTGLGNPIGFKLKGQGYQAFIERKLATSTYYLLGNTKP